jgi:hypothetical protein
LSHSKERAEKVCLNCGQNLNHRFCPVCGQENIEPRETVWAMVSHFAYDITHFDSKFFSTVKQLLLRPGFLSLEHMQGRRARYLNPIRMYVFTSAFFFIIFFSLFNADNIMEGDEDRSQIANKTLMEVKDARESLLKQMLKEKDSVVVRAMQRVNEKLLQEQLRIEAAVTAANRGKDSLLRIKKMKINSEKLVKTTDLLDSTEQGLESGKKKLVILGNDTFQAPVSNSKKSALVIYDDGEEIDGMSAGKIKSAFFSKKAYDDVQKELPDKKQDNWVARSLAHRLIELNSKVKKDEKGTWALLLNKFLHSFPQVFFISLPLSAFLLQLLYIRRKQYYYVDHLLFSIHIYCAWFIILLFYFGLDKLSKYPYSSWLKILAVLVFMVPFFYLYKAMRFFYKQGRIKTIVKFIALNFLTTIVTVVLMSIFFLLSFWNF